MPFVLHLPTVTERLTGASIIMEQEYVGNGLMYSDGIEECTLSRCVCPEQIRGIAA